MKTTWLVSRHAGAQEWLLRRYPRAESRIVAHLDVTAVQNGDRVIGTLPVQAIADICARGATYIHLTIPMAPVHRGRELDADELDALGATLECFHAEHRPLPDND